MNKRIAFIVLLALLSPALFSQSSNSTFPDGTVSGTTSIEDLDATIPFINFEIREPETNQEVAFSVQLLLLLTILTLAPSILILMTSFLRISIVLDFIKRALSLQQVPPTQVLNGIALFLTICIMWPTFTEVYNSAFKPMSDGEINTQTAITRSVGPLRMFMFKQMNNKTEYISMFMAMAKLERPQTLADVPTHILIPAYVLHELTVAFRIGILLYIPFIIIDMIVASILMSMGMMMLPPVQISMPFKLILFILVDGWGLLTQQLFASFVQ